MALQGAPSLLFLQGLGPWCCATSKRPSGAITEWCSLSWRHFPAPWLSLPGMSLKAQSEVHRREGGRRGLGIAFCWNQAPICSLPFQAERKQREMPLLGRYASSKQPFPLLPLLPSLGQAWHHFYHLSQGYLTGQTCGHCMILPCAFGIENQCRFYHVSPEINSKIIFAFNLFICHSMLDFKLWFVFSVRIPWPSFG